MCERSAVSEGSWSQRLIFTVSRARGYSLVSARPVICFSPELTLWAFFGAQELPSMDGPHLDAGGTAVGERVDVVRTRAIKHLSDQGRGQCRCLHACSADRSPATPHRHHGLPLSSATISRSKRCLRPRFGVYARADLPECWAPCPG
jgi:hypothetical protein